jgi:hypothetical protein
MQVKSTARKSGESVKGVMHDVRNALDPESYITQPQLLQRKERRVEVDKFDVPPINILSSLIFKWSDSILSRLKMVRYVIEFNVTDAVKPIFSLKRDPDMECVSEKSRNR